MDRKDGGGITRPSYDDAKLRSPETPGYYPQQTLLPHGSAETSSDAVPRPHQEISLFLKPWFVFLLCALMVAVAVVTELVLMASNRRHGWRAWDLQEFGGVNYLKSLIPVVLTLPISMLWLSVDQAMGKMHPFIVLSKGNAPASRSLLLDYTCGRVYSLLKSFQYRHWVIFASSLVCLANLSLSPLASGLLTTKNTLYVQDNVPITSLKTLGLNPDYGNLEFFVAASGYAAAAAIHNLTDPPFLFYGSWAVAEFTIPAASGAGANQTVFLNTTGVESISNCQPADTQVVVDGDLGGTGVGSSNLTIQGSWSGCNVSFTVPDTEQDQYGVLPLADCAQFPLPPQYQPVIFWFYSFQEKLPSLTFCQPSLQLWNVVAGVDMQTGLVNNVTLLNENVPPSNVSGLAGFNGISFNLTGDDSYVQARAVSTTTTVPFAIYQGATVQPGGVAAVIQQPDGFLNITTNVYTRFLALAAKSVYFVDMPPSSAAQIGQIHSWETRLWVYPLAAHLFSGALLLIAILAGATHIAHVRERRNTYLSCDANTLAGALSMTSRSKFPRLLHAGMNEDDLHNALKGMRFGISPTTWQVVAREEEDGMKVAA